MEERSKVFGAFRLDFREDSVWRDDSRIELAPKAFELLRYLVENAGRTLAAEDLLEVLWPDTHVQPGILKVYIREIRRALGDDARNPTYIETVPRRGYGLIAPVSSVGPDPAGLPLFGRDHALQQLIAAFRRAAGGARQIVFIAGEPGIGKTALVNAFANWLWASSAAHLVRGQCIRTHGWQEPYYPVLEALGRVQLPGFRRALYAQAPTWRIQLPSLLSSEHRERLSRELLPTPPQRMLREGCELLEAITQVGVLVLVLEDAHWADAATVDFLSAVAHRPESAKLMILCTLRPADLIATGHPLRTVSRELAAKSLSTELPLEPLDETAARRYLERVFPGASLPAAFVSRMTNYSGGNPLFLGSIVNRLRERGHARLKRDRWIVARPELDLAVTDEIRELIIGQLALLGSAERELLEGASIVGPAFTAWSVAAILQQTPEQVEAKCNALVARGGLLHPAGSENLPGGILSPRFEFNHILYREVVYRHLSPEHRSGGHRRLADQLESAYGPAVDARAAELIWRYEECRDWKSVVRYSRISAERALLRFAPHEAAALLIRALRFTARFSDAAARLETEFEILGRLAQVQLIAGRVWRGLRSWRVLSAVAERARRWDIAANAALASTRHWSAIQYERGLAEAERALALSERVRDPCLRARAELERSYLTLVLREWSAGDFARCRSAFEYIHGHCAPDETASCAALYSSLQAHASDYEGARTTAASSVTAALHHGDPVAVHDAGHSLRSALLLSGRWGEFLRDHEEAMSRFRRDGSGWWAGSVRLQLAFLHLECMAFQHVVEFAEPARASGALGACRADQLRSLLAAAYAGSQEYDRALRECDAARRPPGSLSPLCARFMLGRVAVVSHLGKGDIDGAFGASTSLLEFVLTTEERTEQALAWHLLARVHRARGDLDQARAAIDSGMAVIERSTVPLAAWRVHGHAALIYDDLGRHAEAVVHRDRARAEIAELAESISLAPDLAESFSAGAAHECAIPRATGAG